MQEQRVEQLEQALKTYGLCIRGVFQPKVGDGVDELIRDGTFSILLIGQLGPSLEQQFRNGQIEKFTKEPLDSWTRYILEPLAKRLGGKALYPFEGPVFYPFQRWGMVSEGLQASPLGLLIHPRYGLWHHYRGALLLPGIWRVESPGEKSHPCDSCEDKPCLSACPVNAYSAQGFNVEACIGHLEAVMGEDCMGYGCQARLACPVGARYHYGPFQQRFHMEAFLKTRGMLEV